MSLQSFGTCLLSLCATSISSRNPQRTHSQFRARVSQALCQQPSTAGCQGPPPSPSGSSTWTLHFAFAQKYTLYTSFTWSNITFLMLDAASEMTGYNHSRCDVALNRLGLKSIVIRPFAVQRVLMFGHSDVPLIRFRPACLGGVLPCLVPALAHGTSSRATRAFSGAASPPHASFRFKAGSNQPPLTSSQYFPSRIKFMPLCDLSSFTPPTAPAQQFESQFDGAGLRSTRQLHQDGCEVHVANFVGGDLHKSHELCSVLNNSKVLIGWDGPIAVLRIRLRTAFPAF